MSPIFGLRLGAPWGLYAALACAQVMAVGFWLDKRRRARALARVGAGAALDRMVAVSPGRRLVGQVAWTLGVVGCVLAAARPQVPAEVALGQRGIDLVVVMDLSTSMLAADVYPSRFERMEREVDALLDRSVSNRVGVVLFAGGAAHFPLTHDREAIRNLYRGVRVGDLPPGSDLASAVRTGRCLVRAGVADDPDCRGVGGRGSGGEELDDEAPGAGASNRLEQASERARALVVFSDGEQTLGDARQELELAARLGVEVFLVGVGTSEGAPVPDLDPRGRVLGWKESPPGTRVESRLDVAALARLAAIAGGDEHLYMIGLDGRPISGLGRALERLQKGTLYGRVGARAHPVYEWFLFPGFILLLVQATLSAARTRPRRRAA